MTYQYSKKKYDNSQVQIKIIDKARDCILEEIQHDYLMSKKHSKACKYLNYVEHLLILASVLQCASIIAVSVAIIRSALGIKNCAITLGSKKYKSITQEKKQKLEKIFWEQKQNQTQSKFDF